MTQARTVVPQGKYVGKWGKIGAAPEALATPITGPDPTEAVDDGGLQ